MGGGSRNSARRTPLSDYPLFFTVLALLGLAGCAHIPNRPPRPAVSTLGCAEFVVNQMVPKNRPDKMLHCLAAGFIARYCSPTEARMAGVGKEVRDLFTGGDAEWADLKADWKGIRCAEHAGDDDAVNACCTVNVATR
jgi:hypothetical protein